MSAEAESVSPEPRPGPEPGPEPGPAAPSAAGPARHGRPAPRLLRRPRGWGWGVPVVLGLAGALFAASALTAHGTDLRAERRTALTDLVRAADQRVRAADSGVVALQGEVAGLTAEQWVRGSDQLVEANARAAALAGPAGLTAVRGPGVTVALDDAPRDRTGMLPDGVTADDLVVHQQDVRAVVNALWAGGAEAMQLMDQRIVSTSAVRCVGNTLVLQGKVYSPPFRVAAIGDPAQLRQALDASPGVKTYRQFVDVVGLGYQVEDQEEITVPAYQGSLRMIGTPRDASGAEAGE